MRREVELLGRVEQRATAPVMLNIKVVPEDGVRQGFRVEVAVGVEMLELVEQAAAPFQMFLMAPGAREGPVVGVLARTVQEQLVLQELV